MTVLVSEILASTSGPLLDPSFRRWDEVTRFAIVKSAQREIVRLKPSASTAYADITVVAGSRQAIPSTALRLLDVPRNLGADGSTPGQPITAIDRAVLDQMFPDWHSETVAAGTPVDHFAFDDRDPKNFWVYPRRPDTNWHIEALVSTPPADIVYVDTWDIAITLDDIWQVAIEDYIIARCLSGPKGREVPGSTQLALAHMQSFYAACDREDMIKLLVTPNRRRPDPSPTKAF